MTNDKNLANELLKQNGLEPEKLSQQIEQRIQQMVARDIKRAKLARRVREIIFLATAIFLAVFCLAANVLPWTRGSKLSSLAMPIFILTIYVVGLSAIICTIIAHVASRNATLKQIQASLADISEELKRQSRDS